MQPYYQDTSVTIYHGDCREILPDLGPVNVILTDPVWPGARTSLQGASHSEQLWAEAAGVFPDAERVVVHIGCDTDPAFLHLLSLRWPFLRFCWLEYACPHYKGRLLYTSDVALVYGSPPSTKKCMVMPGKVVSTKADKKFKRRNAEKHRKGETLDGDYESMPHPCPRRYQHVAWLVGWFAEGTVLDPFMGSGTTIEAAQRAGHKSIGIEIEERFCEVAAKRLEQGVLW